MASTTMSAPRQPSRNLATLLIFIVILVGTVFYVKPLWDDVTNLSLGLQDKMDQKDQLTAQLQNLQNIQASMGNVSEVSRQTALDSIPERFDQDKLITDLTGIAQSNDIILNSVNFSVNAASTDQVKRATVNANLTGDLNGLLGFLKGVESDNRAIVVKTISIQTGTTDTGVPRVNFNVNMETYYLNSL